MEIRSRGFAPPAPFHPLKDMRKKDREI